MVSSPDTRKRLAERLAHLVATQEAERTRLARVLHDELGQTMTAIGLHLDALRLDYVAEAPQLAGRTSEIQTLLEQVITRIRELSEQLNPDIVERAGLPFAMDHLAGRYRPEFGGSLRMLLDPHGRLPRETASSIYRIAEQALDNAVRHSKGNLVEVLLRRVSQGTCLEVSDDGIGFDPDEARHAARGVGLFLMEHLALLSGFEFSIRSECGKGTLVRVLAPGHDSSSGFVREEVVRSPVPLTT